MRLELLEGVAAFYSGNKVLARAKLKSSEQRWQQLQISDGHLAELMSMGFKSYEVGPDKIPRKVSEPCGISEQPGQLIFGIQISVRGRPPGIRESLAELMHMAIESPYYFSSVSG